MNGFESLNRHITYKPLWLLVRWKSLKLRLS